MSTDEAMIVAGTYIKDRSLRDGTRRIEIDLEREQARRFMEMLDGQPDVPLAIARLDEQRERERLQQQAIAEQHEQERDRTPMDTGERRQKPYGKLAQRLHACGFFRSPDVWKAAGKDEHYAAWCRQQPSAISGTFDVDEDTGEMSCEYAHVRRISEGAGVGIKPPFCGIPLRHHEHRLQHDQGESAIVPARHREDAKRYIEKLRIEHVSAWAKHAIKHDIGYESFGDVPPAVMRAWAERVGVEKYLPAEYAEA